MLVLEGVMWVPGSQVCYQSFDEQFLYIQLGCGDIDVSREESHVSQIGFNRKLQMNILFVEASQLCYHVSSVLLVKVKF